MDVKKTHKPSYSLVKDFLGLLENQFPANRFHTIDRSPSNYANRLGVHVNYLNKLVKNHLDKTTTQVIADVVFEESKRLLMETSWSIIEVSHALGFSEPNHFSTFFKKRSNKSPSMFRKSEIPED
jgi:AraC-like DNA-binding protein